jgi:hypothetical protein
LCGGGDDLACRVKEADFHFFVLGDEEISDPNIDWNRLFVFFTLTEDAVWAGGERTKAVNALSYLLDLSPEYPEGFNRGKADDD